MKPQFGGRQNGHVLRVRVSAEQLQDLKQVAKTNLTTLSDAIREAVDEYASDCRDRGVFVKCRTRQDS